MNTPDKIYEEFKAEIDDCRFTADTPVTIVMGQVLRALKRVVQNNGGTAYQIDGKRYGINDERLDD